MLKKFLLLKTIIPFIIPYIILYAIYIQLNGEVSPGGGFQAGVIFATGLIAYDLVFGKNHLSQHISIDRPAIPTCHPEEAVGRRRDPEAPEGQQSSKNNIKLDPYVALRAPLDDERELLIDGLTICGVLGVAIYAGTGIVSLIFNDNYLDYNSIANNNITGQHIGIFSIELGVGLTVASVMFLIYSLLREE